MTIAYSQGFEVLLFVFFASFSLDIWFICFLYEMKILEEMKCMEVKPNVQTYICLLNACAAGGRIDRVYVASTSCTI